MKILIRRIRLSLLLFLGIFFLFSSLVFYRPFYREVEQRLEQTFSYQARERATRLQQYTEYHARHARAISADPSSRREILRYFSGQSEWARLAQNSWPMFRDSLHAIEDVVYAARIVDQEILIDFGDDRFGRAASMQTPPRVEFSHEVMQDSWFLVLHSPIFEGNRILGHDVFVINLETVMHSLAHATMDVTLLQAASLEPEIAETIRPTSRTDAHFYQAQGQAHFLTLLADEEHVLKISQDERALYQPLHRLMVTNLLTLAGVFSLVFFTISFLVGFHAQKIFSYLEKTIQTQQEALQEASFDPTTGALTRPEGLRQMKQYYLIARHRGWPLCLCFFDVDGLKEVNDQLGHACGDELMLTIGKVARRHIRRQDVFVRYGGDEFIIAMPQAKAATAQAVWQRIQRHFSRINRQERRPYIISASHGVVQIDPASTKPLEHHLKRADEKMYQEKKARRSQRSVLRTD